jgi:hypothetical protein
MLFDGQREAAAAQLDFAFDHQLGDFNIWTETNPKVAAHNGTGNLNFLTGAGGFLENLVFGYGGLRYSAAGLSIGASLPPHGTSQLTLRGIAFAGGTVRLVVNATHQTLSRTAGAALTVDGKPLAWWPAATVLPLGTVELRLASRTK